MAAELRPCAVCGADPELERMAELGIIGPPENRPAVVMVPTAPAEEVPLCVPCARAYSEEGRAFGRWRWLTTVVTPPWHDCRDHAELFSDEAGLGYFCSVCQRVIGDGEWGR